MIVVPESAISGLIGFEECVEAVERVFAAMAAGTGLNFPVVREAVGDEGALFGVKAGFDREGATLGLKSGGFWPGNAEKGITNHQSTILLFDASSGQCRAMLGGNLLSALRTAAASAISIKHLARQDAKVLGIVGAGHQSTFQLRAALMQRDFQRVVGWNIQPEQLSRLHAVACERGVPFEAVELDRLGGEADVIITITSSFRPILKASQVRPGSHIACMGTDTKGKQEVEAALVASATVFADEVEQSATIGECQHAVAAGSLERARITPIGSVLIGKHPGRSSQDEITLFDGTGVALQDLVVASAAARIAVERGIAIEVEI